VSRGTLAEAAARAAAGEPIGEHVIVLGGAPAPAAATDDDLRGALARARAAGRSARDAAADVAAAYDVPRRRVYELGLRPEA
jgi:16S rRNA (cytidine1402-2'-O)-methyltransferase